MKKPALLLLLALGLLAAFGPPRLSAAPVASADFARFVDDYFDAQFAAHRPSAGPRPGCTSTTTSSRTSRARACSTRASPS